MTPTVQVVLPVAFFVLAGALVTLIERVAPVRSVAWRKDLGFDLFSVVWSFSVSGVLLLAVPRAMAPLDPLRPAWLAQSPLIARGITFLLLCDFSKYSFHWLMHGKLLWRAHKLHHSPTELYWMAGNRASLVMLGLHFGPMAVFAWLFDVGPAFALANGLLNIAWNHIMHMNIAIPARVQRTLEWICVTPRYHHIHHALDRELADTNLGSVLTVWDRLFGTYKNPDEVDPATLRFGDGSRPSDSKVAAVIGV